MNRNARGFSLVELLVAMAIMSMTIMIASMGYSFFTDRWYSERHKFQKAATISRNLKATHSAINGIYPYLLNTSSKEVGVYFEGNQDAFITVTSRSLAEPDVPAVIRIAVSQLDNFEYVLTYEEASMRMAPVVSASQPINFSSPVVLLTGVSDIKLEYYGFENIDGLTSGSAKSWWQTFNGFQRKLLPDAIRIAFVWEGQQQQLEFGLNQLDPRQLSLFSDDT